MKQALKKKFAFLMMSVLVMSAVFSARIVPPTGVYAAEEVSISRKKATVYVGKTKTLKLNGAVGDVYWGSSDKSVATVSSTGKVKAISAGKAVITAVNDGSAYSCTVTVKVKSDTSDTTTKTAADKELTAKEVYAKCSSGVVEINTGNAIGSGFYISEDRVVTNYHVIKDASKLIIKTLDEKEYKVVGIAGYDADLDLAVLQVEHKGTPLALNTHGITMGETTYTIGSSLGLTNTFSNGMVSNTKRIMDGVTYIQTNTAISPGNSGGPLLNAYGEVMGITTSTFTEGQNLNLAINVLELDKLKLDSPKTVEEYLTRIRYNDDGTEIPNITAHVEYDGAGKHSSCYLYIANNGTKTLTLGGSSRNSTVYIYPSDATNSMGYYNYTTGYWCDSYGNRLRSLECGAGDSGYAGIRLSTTQYFDAGAAVVFYLIYDGRQYIAMVDEYGNVEIE